MMKITCPVCKRSIYATTPSGKPVLHLKYADGAGQGPDQPHDMIPCEGGSID